MGVPSEKGRTTATPTAQAPQHDAQPDCRPTRARMDREQDWEGARQAPHHHSLPPCGNEAALCGGMSSGGDDGWPAMTRKEQRDYRTERGLCLNCPSQVEPGCRRCAKCLLKLRSSYRTRMELYAVTLPPEESEDALDAKLSALGRCRCGLLRPCNDCIPGLDEYAGMRRSA